MISKQVTSLLGKNVQVTRLLFANQTISIRLALYEFDKGTRIVAPAESTLFFVLQAVFKRTAYRFEVRGASVSFLRPPLNETELSAIATFEKPFTSVFSMFNGKLKLQHVRNNDTLVSCVFTESMRLGNRVKVERHKRVSTPRGRLGERPGPKTP